MFKRTEKVQKPVKPRQPSRADNVATLMLSVSVFPDEFLEETLLLTTEAYAERYPESVS